jgi:hypothetical protein
MPANQVRCTSTNAKFINPLVKKSSALLMQDDAHGFGVFEPIIPQNSIYMATLGLVRPNQAHL